MKLFNEIEHDKTILVSNILNDTKAYIKIGEALGIEIDCDSYIFSDIEEFIKEKYNEMLEENNC